MSGLKRKRSYSPAANALAVYRPFKSPYKRPYVKSRKFIPGVDRTGGFYGRYASRDGELKFHDVDLDDAIIAVGGQVTPTINIIPQGITEVTRIGRKCTIKSINWRFRLTLQENDAVATPGNVETTRVILYQDKQCNGATAAVTDLLETDDVHSFRNLANSGRFNFIYDKIYAMNYMGMASDGVGLVSQGPNSREISMYKKCDIPLEFNSSASDGSLATIRSNNLGVMLVCLSGTASFNSKIRLRFSDN